MGMSRALLALFSMYFKLTDLFHVLSSVIVVELGDSMYPLGPLGRGKFFSSWEERGATCRRQNTQQNQKFLARHDTT